MKLQERDFAVLAALERWGVMGLGQVDGMLFHKEVIAEERARLFFNEVRREDYWGRAYKRLSGLEKLGLVRVRRFPYSWPVYLLTAQGFELLKRRGKTRFETPSQGVSDRLVRHEIAVGGVGLVLTQVLGLAVSTARETWDWAGRNYGRRTREARLTMPDLMVGKVGGNVEHIVEVELTPKSRKRYSDIFTSHRRRLPDHRTSKILYLVDWPGGVRQITSLGYKYETSEVHAASLSEFRATLGHCEFAPSFPRNYGPFILAAKPEAMPEAPRGAEQEVSR
jgi:hypothetical protein